jgi:uncharacterized protein YndB with AHSA1/START domain
MSTTVNLRRTIPAPPARVYRAWLDPELLQRWMAPGAMTVAKAEVDERAGGHFRIFHSDDGTDTGGFDAEILDLEPDRRLVLRWGFVGPRRRDADTFDSLLTVTFDDAPGGATLLTLRHERLDELAAARPEVADGVADGWSSALDKLTEAVRP